MLRLTWYRKNHPNQFGFVLGDPESIRDLYWQLTKNYKANDGTAIGEIKVHSLDGDEVEYIDLMMNPHSTTYPNTYLGD